MISLAVTVLKWPTGLPIPECPPNEDEHQWKAAFQDATVYLIGTAHFRYLKNKKIYMISEGSRKVLYFSNVFLVLVFLGY